MAIKIVTKENSDSLEMLDRFFAEARAVNLIAHENIVNVVELRKDESSVAVQMEFIDGPNAASYVRKVERESQRFLDLEEAGKIRVMAVSRLGVAQVPTPELVAQEGDVVYLGVAGDAMASVDDRLAGPVKAGGH